MALGGNRLPSNAFIRHSTAACTMSSLPWDYRTSVECCSLLQTSGKAAFRSPPTCCRVMPLLSLAVLACIVFVGYKLYYAPFMRHQALYAVGALCIYWFSVSGEVPMLCRCLPPSAGSARVVVAGDGATTPCPGYIQGPTIVKHVWAEGLKSQTWKTSLQPKEAGCIERGPL